MGLAVTDDKISYMLSTVKEAAHIDSLVSIYATLLMWHKNLYTLALTSTLQPCDQKEIISSA